MEKFFRLSSVFSTDTSCTHAMTKIQSKTQLDSFISLVARIESLLHQVKYFFLQQIQVPPSYTDSGRVTPQNEPFDPTPQEYSVIQPVLPNPSEKNWEIPRESLVFVKVIGKGAFGKVAKGMATGIDDSKENRLVAIKMLRGAMLNWF